LGGSSPLQVPLAVAVAVHAAGVDAPPRGWRRWAEGARHGERSEAWWGAREGTLLLEASGAGATAVCRWAEASAATVDVGTTARSSDIRFRSGHLGGRRLCRCPRSHHSSAITLADTWRRLLLVCKRMSTRRRRHSCVMRPTPCRRHTAAAAAHSVCCADRALAPSPGATGPSRTGEPPAHPPTTSSLSPLRQGWALGRPLYRQLAGSRTPAAAPRTRGWAAHRGAPRGGGPGPGRTTAPGAPSGRRRPGRRRVRRRRGSARGQRRRRARRR